MSYIFACLISGLPLVVVELLSRVVKLNPELSRKTTHTLSAVAIMIVANLYEIRLLIPVSITFLLFMLATRTMTFWKSLYSVERDTIGEIAFVIGVGIAATLVNSLDVFMFAMASLGFADTIAYFFGSRYGTKNIGVWDKTYLGTAAFFISCLIIALITLDVNFSPGGYLLTAVVVTAMEVVARKGWDNVSVPIGAVLIVQFLA
jgi:dolichol kinase